MCASEQRDDVDELHGLCWTLQST